MGKAGNPSIYFTAASPYHGGVDEAQNEHEQFVDVGQHQVEVWSKCIQVPSNSLYYVDVDTYSHWTGNIV